MFQEFILTHDALFPIRLSFKLSSLLYKQPAHLTMPCFENLENLREFHIGEIVQAQTTEIVLSEVMGFMLTTVCAFVLITIDQFVLFYTSVWRTFNPETCLSSYESHVPKVFFSLLLFCQFTAFSLGCKCSNVKNFIKSHTFLVKRLVSGVFAVRVGSSSDRTKMISFVIVNYQEKTMREIHVLLGMLFRINSFQVFWMDKVLYHLF